MTSINVPEPFIVTKEFLRALQGASRIAFRHERGSTNAFSAGSGAIIAYRPCCKNRECRNEHSDTFIVPSRLSIWEEVDGGKYQTNTPVSEHGQYSGWTNVHQYRDSSDEWDTTGWIDALKVGDNIRLMWMRNTRDTSKYGLVCDDLRLNVTRGKRRFGFLVAEYTGTKLAGRFVRNPAEQ